MKKLFTLLFMSVLSLSFITAAPAYKVLVLTERGGQHGAFTDAALKWLSSQKTAQNFEIVEINNTNTVNEKYLSDFKLIIQLDYPPYSWTKEAEKAFINYIDEGEGGWIGFHHATLLGEFDNYPMWHWFSDFMGGIRFKNYIAEKAAATVRIEDRNHPVMKGVNTSFIIPDDEWYTFDKNPRPNVQVLANVDENTYNPASEIKMGDHPVIWTNPYKNARNVYFLMGHSAQLFDSGDFKKMFANAIEWASSGDKNNLPYAGAYARAPRFKALIYYSENVEEAHRKFAEQGVEFFRRLNYGEGFCYDVTKTLADYPYEKLKEYDIIVMLNSSPTSQEERDAFRKYMENGGGWMGFHAAGYNDRNTKWDWYVNDFLGGGVFYCNNWPPQPAKLTVDYPDHPVTKNLPESFIAPESEWYQWKPSPRENKDIDVLVSLSHDNYPIGIKDVVRYGDFPVVWANRKYRMVYLNMGHGDDEFTDATQKLLFINAFRWVVSNDKNGDPLKKEKIRLAFINGMNPKFNAGLYAPVLDDFPGVTWKAYTNEESQELFKAKNKNKYDVIVFHDICLDEIPESTKQDIMKVISEGKPVLILHDGLLTYNKWSEFAEISGMKYFMSQQEINGKKYSVSTYRHNQDIPIRIADKSHFITQGMDETFILHDEIYGKLWKSPNIHALWTTSHPESNKEMMYTHQYGKGKIVGIVMGHGPDIFKDKNYRIAFQRSILWLAGN
jgi:type 1 glutamine amidotransferase